MDVVNADKPSWASFFAWSIVGAALSFSVLGAMTIGLFVFPFAIAGLVALLKWGGNRKNSVGLISGVGLPLLYIAYINRSGPGMICNTFGNGGQRCDEEMSPWPWLIIGTVLVVAGVMLFVRLRRATDRVL